MPTVGSTLPDGLLPATSKIQNKRIMTHLRKLLTAHILFRLAYASHDSTLSVVDASTQDHTVQAVRYRYLPLVDLLWINENSIVGVGHDCNPFLFQKQGGNW
jgi:hypothetical protein